MGRIRIIRQGKRKKNTEKKLSLFQPSEKYLKMSEQQIIYQMEPASQIVDFPINEDTFSVYSDNSNPRYSPYPESAPSKAGSSSRRRPGRNPEVPDEALDQIALERRNRRRERNRLAAARCRD